MTVDESFNVHNKIIDAAFKYMQETADKSGMTLDTDIIRSILCFRQFSKFQRCWAALAGSAIWGR